MDTTFFLIIVKKGCAVGSVADLGVKTAPIWPFPPRWCRVSGCGVQFPTSNLRICLCTVMQMLYHWSQKHYIHHIHIAENLIHVARCYITP